MSKPSKSHHRSSLALRLAAALCVVVWTAATGFCSVESAFGHVEALTHSEHHDADHHHAKTSTLPESSEQSDESPPGNHGEDACCSSLNASLPPVCSTSFAKPDFGTLFNVSPAWFEQMPMLGYVAASFTRHALSENRLFTPELFLGPAFRANAPPSFA